MIIVAVETSTSSGSVGIGDGLGRGLQRILPEDKPSSETLLPAVEDLLAEAGIRKDAVGGLAVGVGPGSFTGLRVALATVKGWASAASLPIAPVASLDAVALPVLASGRQALVAADARKGEVYAASYDGLLPEKLPARSGPVLLASPEEAADHLQRVAREGAVLVGTGADLVRPFLGRGWDVGAGGGLDPHPRALAVLQLGRRLIDLGRGTDPGGLVPFYVRPPDVHPTRRSPGAG